MKVNAKTDKGGAVVLNEEHHVWASYAVGSVGASPPEILCAGATLDDGRRVQFFLNRKTNLIVADVIDADDLGGVEILRRTV